MLNRCINEACGNPNRISGMYMYTIKHIIWVEKISGAMIIYAIEIFNLLKVL